ncbi:MAG: phosphorylase [Desertifilum sp.]|nr:phosphorylase [Desertifilum sp.]
MNRAVVENLVLLVPQGAEYQAVCRGLKQHPGTVPFVLPIPVGVNAVRRYLQTWKQLPKQVCVLGLCGSLNPEYQVGEIVLYQKCLYVRGELRKQECHPALTTRLQAQLNSKAKLGTALTCDRILHLAADKRNLGETYSADIVDMEGFAVLDILSPLGVEVAMLRVVSDDCNGDLPNLAGTLSEEGALLPLPLAMRMIRQPLAASRLIRGSLKALQVLQILVQTLNFS